MPVTPFHFGPGLLGKGLLPRWWSWSAFGIVNVVIDVESGYHLVRGDWPIHRELHTFVGATLVAIATTIVLIALARVLRAPLAKIASPIWHGEVSAIGIAIGSLAGGLSHPLLDGVMHTDIQPFQPWTTANPLHDLVGVAVLQLACVVAGLLGAVLLAHRARRVPARVTKVTGPRSNQSER